MRQSQLRFSLLAIWSVAAVAAGPPLAPPTDELTGYLQSKGIAEPKVISYIDLAKGFGTTSTWVLAVVQDSASYNPDWVSHGGTYVCFLKSHIPDCLDGSGKSALIEKAPNDGPFELLEARIVQAASGETSPRLIVKTCTESGGNGNCGIETTVYACDKKADRFPQVFYNRTGRNNNQVTRFVENGPLRGHILVGLPSENAPFTYWIEVYGQQETGSFTQVLRYRGNTRYGDGNRLAVIDSEMPETLRRLGLWKTGDALPVPPKLPSGCSTVFLRKDVEWCR